MSKNQMAFYFDQNRCMGCNTCVVACKDWNDVKPGPANWRRKYSSEDGVFPNLSVFNLIMSCNHCTNPACLTACPIGAIYKRQEDGIVLVDRNLCYSLKLCQTACPFGAPQFGDNKSEPEKMSSWMVDHPMQKCTFCWDRLAEGKAPACVAACPQRAIDYGFIEDLYKKYPDAQKTVIGFPDSTIASDGTKLELDTIPNILFKPKSK